MRLIHPRLCIALNVVFGSLQNLNSLHQVHECVLTRMTIKNVPLGAAEAGLSARVPGTAEETDGGARARV